MKCDKKALVLGFGHWGKAISFILLRQGFYVTAWARNVSSFKFSPAEKRSYTHVEAQKLDMQTQFGGDEKTFDYIFLTLPSSAYREVFKISHLQDKIKNSKNLCIVNCSKGIQYPSLQTMCELVHSSFKNFSRQRYAVISGPGFSNEILSQNPTALVIASSSKRLGDTLQMELMHPMLRLYTSKDVLGVELAGSLKNVLAIALGMCHGLKFGVNTKAALLTRGMHEISRLGHCLGAKQNTFWGLAGIGDLFLTATSMQSRNYTLGFLLGSGKSLKESIRDINQTIEGVETVRAVYLMAKKYHVEMPIAEKIYEVIWKNLSIEKAIDMILSRVPKNEMD